MRLRQLGLFLFTAALCALAPATFAQSAAGPEDQALFTTAVANTAAQPSYAFDVFLDTRVDAPGSSLTLTVEGEGAVDTLGSTPALTLDLRGQMVADGDDFPIDLALRLQDGVLYYTIAGSSSDPTLWTGLRLADLQPLIDAQMAGNSSSGVPSDIGALGDSVSQLSGVFAASGISTEEFVTLTRNGESEVDGTPVVDFSLNVSLADFVKADGFVSLLRGLVTAIPELDGEALGNNARLIGVALSSLFENTTIRYDARIDPAAELVRSGEFVVNAALDPAVLGDTSGPVSVEFDLAVDLRDFGLPQTVSVPAGVSVMSGAEVAALFGSGDIQVGGQTVAPVLPTPTTLAAVPTPPPSGLVNAQSLSANVPVQIVLPGDTPVELAYTGTSRELITVSARSLDASIGLDTTVELLDAAGVRLGFNDDMAGSRPGFGTLDSVIADVTLPASGVYRVVVNSFAPGVSGPVEVMVGTGSSLAVVPTPASVPSGEYPIMEVTQRTVPTTGQDCATLDLRAGESVTISVRALDPALDPAATLNGPNGSQIAFNDDHGSNDTSLGRFDSRIEAVSVTEDGAYSLCVTGFAGSSGPYELTVIREIGGSTTLISPTPASLPSQSDEQVVTGEVPADQTFETSFDAEAGDVFTITVQATGGDLDPQVGVFADNDDVLLFYSDDVGLTDGGLAPTDSVISNLIIEHSGTYDAVVAGYQSTSGPFELTITRTATGAPVGQSEIETVSGKIAENGVYTYPVTLPAGAYVTFTVAAGDDQFDPQLSLIGPDGVVAATNDDHSSEDDVIRFTDSRIRNFLVTIPGTYVVEIRGYQGSGGPFTLTIETRQ